MTLPNRSASAASGQSRSRPRCGLKSSHRVTNRRRLTDKERVMNRIKELQAKYEADGEVDWAELALALLAEYQTATESLAQATESLAKATTAMRVWKARYEHQKE